MKKIAAIFCFILILNGAITAQQSDPGEFRTIFGNPEIKSIGGYGALQAGYTQINNLDAIIVGARGAVIFDQSIAIGLGGNGFMSKPMFDNNLQFDYEFAGGYGGIYIEPIFMGNRPVHLSFPTLIGAGGIGYLKHWGEYADDNDYPSVDEDSYAFFVFEPGVELEFNVIRWARLAIFCSYRLTTDVKLKYKSNLTEEREFAGDPIAPAGLLRGMNFGLIMKFGKF
jgi:hypothetical protein